VCALKPTYNTLPRAGFKPGADSLDTIGFYARSVEDLGFFAAALTDRRELDAPAAKPARIGLCRTYEWDRVQPEMRRALEEAGRKLGAKEIELPARFKGLRESHAAILWYEASRGLTDEVLRFPDKIDPVLRERCAAGFALDPQEYVRALRHGAECRAHLDEAFGGCDVLLAPAATGEAPKGLASTGDVACNVVWTLLHAPCIAVPAGRGPNGLPLGLQVIGRIGDDALTLAFSAWIEKQLS
jgi:amidase